MPMFSSFIKKLHAIFLISISLLLITSLASYITIKKLKTSASLVNHTHIVIGKLEELLSKMKDVETGNRGFLLSDNEIFLEPYYQAESLIPQIISDLNSLIKDNPLQQNELKKLNKQIDDKNNQTANFINLKRAGETISQEQ